jgi:hypothetical protein
MAWSDFHGDPRKSYYLFLRQGYQYSAHAAHARLKCIDSMVVDLQNPTPGWLPAFCRQGMSSLVRGIAVVGQSLKRMWRAQAPIRQ